jgi:hypothetical protein
MPSPHSPEEERAINMVALAILDTDIDAYYAAFVAESDTVRASRLHAAYTALLNLRRKLFGAPWRDE